MTTNTPLKDCDFCRRDEGMSVFLTRPLVGMYISENPLSADNIDKLHDLTITKKQLDNLNKWHAKGGSLNYEDDNNGLGIINLKQYLNLSLPENSPLNFYYHTLRMGYLYVYLEHQKKLKTYSVSPSGYLKEINSPHIMLQSPNLEPCDSDVHKTKALTITIPDVDNATKVWFKFSDVAWTDERKAFFEKNYAQYMQVFDVRGFLNGTRQEHVYPLIQAGHYTIVYNTSSEKEHDDFGMSCNHINYGSSLVGLYGAWGDTKPIFDDKDKCLEIAQDDRKIRQHLGAMVCINDPVAILQDIGGYLYKEKLSTEHLSAEEVTAQMLNTLSSAIPNAKIESELDELERTYPENRYENDLAIQDMKGLREIKIRKEAKEEWQDDYGKYIHQDLLNKHASKAQQKDHDRNKVIEDGLGIFVVELLQSPQLIDHLDSIFDPMDKRQQVMFAELVGDICENIVCSNKVSDYLAKCLLKKEIDKTNFFLRAFTLNSDKINQTLQGSSVIVNSFAGVLWGDLIKETSSIAKLLINLREGDLFYRSVHKLTLIALPLVLSIQMGLTQVDMPEHVVQARLNRPLLMISASLELPIKTLSISTSSPDAFYETLSTKLHQVNKTMGIRSDRHKIKKDLRKADLYQSAKNSGRRIQLHIVESQVKNANSISDWFNTAQKGYQPLVLVNPQSNAGNTSILDQVSRNIDRLDLNFGLMGAVHSANTLFQVWSLWSVFKGIMDGSYSSGTKIAEGTSRVLAGVMAVSLAAIDMADHALTKLAQTQRMRAGSLLYKAKDAITWIKTTRVSSFFYFRGFPIGIGLMTGLWDVYNGIKDFQVGKEVDGLGLAASGGALAISSILIVVGSQTAIAGAGAGAAAGGLAFVPVVGWALLAIGVVGSIILISTKQNEIQIWVRRSLLGDPSWYLGINRYNPYSSFEEQQHEWNKLMGVN